MTKTWAEVHYTERKGIYTCTVVYNDDKFDVIDHLGKPIRDRETAETAVYRAFQRKLGSQPAEIVHRATLFIRED